jgi:ssDNA-specific exonuclease RecJ
MFEELDTERDTLLEIFSALRREVNSLNGETAEKLVALCGGLGFDRRQFLFAINVFKDLGLISFEEGGLTIYRGVKADLNDSAIYRKIKVLKAE